MRYLSSLLLVLVATLTYSQEIRDTIDLDQISVQAYRAAPTQPITFQNLSKAQIELTYIGQDPSYVLGFTPSITTHSDGGGYQGYSYFRLRGIDQTRINMTLDGIPLNESEDQGAYFSNYPDFLNSINSVQIQRGVGTSSNGVSSYAGSVNFQSPNLTDDPVGQIGASYGSYNTSRVFGEYLTGKTGNFSSYFRASSSSSDGYKQRSNNQSTSIFGSGAWYSGKNTVKITGFLGNQRNNQAWIGVSKQQIAVDPTTNGNTDERDNFSQQLISVQYSRYITSKLVWNATTYYNHLKGNYDFDLDNFLGNNTSDPLYNYDLNHNMFGGFTNATMIVNRIKFTVGGHANLYNRTHTGSIERVHPLYKNTGYKNEASAFAKGQFSIGNFTAFGDMQMRYADFSYKGSTVMAPVNWTFINPKFGASYQVSPSALVYYSYGQSGREPTRNNMFAGEDDLVTFTNISPEYVQDHEAGVRYSVSKYTVEANMYLMNFRDEITLNGQVGPTGLPLHSNVKSSFRSGLEVQCTAQITKSLSYAGNVSVAYNRINSSGVYSQPILSPSLVSSHIVTFTAGNFILGTTVKGQNSSYIDFENVNKAPGFFTINPFTQYTLSRATIRLDVNNITNQLIYSNGYIGIDGTPLYFVQAPINFNFGVTWKI